MSTPGITESVTLYVVCVLYIMSIVGAKFLEEAVSKCCLQNGGTVGGGQANLKTSNHQLKIMMSLLFYQKGKKWSEKHHFSEQAKQFYARQMK